MKVMWRILLITTLFFNTILVFNPGITKADTVHSRDVKEIKPDLVLSDFEEGIDGWQAGLNVASIASVTSTHNNPGQAYSGSNTLEIHSTVCPGTQWRSCYKEFITPLDLRNTPYFVVALNSFGINSQHTGFEAKITFFSDSNSTSSTFSNKDDCWNPIFVNISDFAYKNSITRIEIGFRSVSYSSNWLAKHQIDYAGFCAGEEWSFNQDNQFEYDDMVNLMSKSYMIMTDSGGLQEEAPALGKPVLVLRTETERPEAVSMGTVKVTGVVEEDIYNDTKILLTDRVVYEKMASAVNPYGDGKASERIVSAIETYFSKNTER